MEFSILLRLAGGVMNLILSLPCPDNIQGRGFNLFDFFLKEKQTL